jgi:hypothetical protein
MKNAGSNNRRADRRPRISEEHITRLLEARKMTRAELAGLLNINTASLSRWIDPRNRQAPTSTTYLVLIPLLLAAGVEFLPPADPAVVESQLATFKGLGLLKEGELRSDKVRKSLQRAVAVLNSEEVRASRRLFQALHEAWQKVDESLLHKR